MRISSSASANWLTDAYRNDANTKTIFRCLLSLPLLSVADKACLRRFDDNVYSRLEFLQAVSHGSAQQRPPYRCHGFGQQLTWRWSSKRWCRSRCGRRCAGAATGGRHLYFNWWHRWILIETLRHLIEWSVSYLAINTAYIALYYTGLSVKLKFLFLVISRSTHACPAFSTPANLVPRFPVPRFQCPQINVIVFVINLPFPSLPVGILLPVRLPVLLSLQIPFAFFLQGCHWPVPSLCVFVSLYVSLYVRTGAQTSKHSGSVCTCRQSCNVR